MPTPNLAILTVGTGTAGKHSNLAQGLINTLLKLRPRQFWLVPSSSQDSITVADLVREGVAADLPDAWQAWQSTTELPYLCISDHDNLEVCRQTIKQLIRAARSNLLSGEKLVINPVSGTKQMSVGATLAALDEEIGDIVFTIGDRQDGVVVTGTERLASFDPVSYFAERDLAKAEALFQAGSFWSAAKLLEVHGTPVARQARWKALCMHEWCRMNYSKAADYAERFSPTVAQRLRALAAEPPISLSVLLDLFATAQQLLLWGDADEALARYYRGTEMAAKLILQQAFQVSPNSSNRADGYGVETLCGIVGEVPLAAELRSRARRNVVPLGLDLAWRILDRLEHPAGLSFIQEPQLRDILDRRNQGFYGHGNRSADPRDVEQLESGLRGLFKAHYPAAAAWPTAYRLTSLLP